MARATSAARRQPEGQISDHGRTWNRSELHIDCLDSATAARTASLSRTSSSRVRPRTAARFCGVGALGGLSATMPGLHQPGHYQVKEPVSPPLLQQSVAGVAKHAVVEVKVVGIEAERPLKSIRYRTASTALWSHRPRNRSTLTVSNWQASSRSPPGDTSQRSPHCLADWQAGPHPHRRRPGRVARLRHLHGHLRDLDPQAGTGQHHALLKGLAGLTSPAAREACAFDSDELSLVLR